MRDFIFVTSMNQRLFSEYGERFIREFLQNKGNEIFLNIVFEDGIPNGLALLPGLNCLEIKDSNHPRFKSLFGKLYEANGWKISQQKLPNGKIETKLFHDFRFDANRFSFKIFSLILSKKKDKSSLPFAWIDADVRCLKNFSSQDIYPFMPEKNQLMSYLGRDNFPPQNPYSETGFLGFNAEHTKIDSFLKRMEDIYLTGEIFTQKQWTDSWLWDYVRREYEQKGIRFKNISGEFSHTNHPFINTGLGQYFDHLKGPKRKKLGKSFDKDYIVKK